MPRPRTRYEAEIGLSALGPHGAVWPQRYLEHMQEAAACASAARGFPPDRYQRMGASWFIREIHLEVHRPLGYGEVLTIETWISDLRRFRTRRQYRMTVGGALVVRGEADWLFLAQDPATGKVRPRHPDDEMKAAFPIDPETVFSKDEIPEWPRFEAMDAQADVARTVQPTEIDRHGHVNHVHYLAWCEDHAHRVLDPPGALTFVRLSYDADARPGDDVRLALARVPGGLFHQVFRGEQRLLRAFTRRAPG